MPILQNILKILNALQSGLPNLLIIYHQLSARGNIWSSQDAQNAMEQGADLIGVARAAIPYPDWTKNIIDPKYAPPRGPYTSQQLKKAQLSDVFINYMRNWKGFVVD